MSIGILSRSVFRIRRLLPPHNALIISEYFHIQSFLTQSPKRISHCAILKIAVKIKEETVLPRPVFHRTALNLIHIQIIIVSENYDLLVKFENYIVAEQIIKIDNCLLGLKGTTEEEIIDRTHCITKCFYMEAVYRFAEISKHCRLAVGTGRPLKNHPCMLRVKRGK